MRIFDQIFHPHARRSRIRHRKRSASTSTGPHFRFRKFRLRRRPCRSSMLAITTVMAPIANEGHENKMKASRTIRQPPRWPFSQRFAPVYWLITISLKQESRPVRSAAPLGSTSHRRPSTISKRFNPEAFTRYFAKLHRPSQPPSTLLALLLGVPAAYGLSRFPLAQKLSFWILSTRMPPAPS